MEATRGGYARVRAFLVCRTAVFRQRCQFCNGPIGGTGMRVSIQAGDRTLLIVSGVLLLLISLAAALFAPRGGNASPGYPSSYSATGSGAKGAYLLLGELGYTVERWPNPPRELPDPAENVTLILADPFFPAFSEESTDLKLFLRRGGRILVAGKGGASLLDLIG